MSGPKFDPAAQKQPVNSHAASPTPPVALPKAAGLAKPTNGHDPSPKGQGHKRANGNHSASPKATAGEGADFADANVSPALKKHAEQLIAVTERHIHGVTGRLENVEQLDDSELKRFKDVLTENRVELQTLIIELPSGGQVQERVAKASESVTAVLNRVEAVTRAHEGRAATAGDAANVNKDIAFREASEKAPLGYCDIAPSHLAPCELDEAQRATYRQNIRDVATRMEIAWVAAINAVKLEEKLKKDEVPFSQVLGELLLAILTDGVSLGVKTLVAKGLGAVEKGMTKELVAGYGEVPAVTSKPDMRAANWIGSEVADKGTHKAIEKEREHNGSMTAEQFTQQSKQGLQVPDSRDAFLQVMKQAPSTWSANIIGNVNQLFDADLAALVAGLPDLKSINQGMYETQVNRLLTKYDEQVLIIEPLSEVTVAMVAFPDGTQRQALVYPEKKADAHLAGEWKNSPVNTGKWTFVRWIADGFRDMAVTRAVQKDRDLSVAARVKWSGDASFWDEKSLETFKAGPNSEDTSDT